MADRLDEALRSLGELLGYTGATLEAFVAGREGPVRRVIDERSSDAPPVTERQDGRAVGLAANMRLLAEVRAVNAKLDQLLRRPVG